MMKLIRKQLSVTARRWVTPAKPAAPRRNADLEEALMTRSRGWIVGFVVLAGLAAGPTAAHAQTLSPLGDQRVLVIPIKHTPPFCPDNGQSCPAGIPQALTSQPGAPNPRNSAARLGRILDRGLNAQYAFASYGSVHVAIRVVANPGSSDGWWTPPRSVQAYANAPSNFGSGGIVHDAIENILTRAVERRVISLAEVARHGRVLVVDNWSSRGGQASGITPQPYNVAGRTLRFTASINAEDANDDQLVAVAKHEFGHQMFLDYDLYSTPCLGDGDGDGVARRDELGPCACPLRDPGATQTPALGTQADCVGRWDSMAYDTPGISFSSHTRMLAGWMRGSDPYVRTVDAAGFRGTVSLRPLNRVPVAGRTSVLRMTSLIGTTLSAVERFVGVGSGNGFVGYQGECRRRESDDAGLLAEGPFLREGVVLSYVDEGRGGNKSMYVVRRTPDEHHDTAVLEPGETYTNPTTGLTFTMAGFGPDGDCIVDVNWSPARASATAAPVARDVVRMAGRVDLAGRRSSTAIFSAGAVALGNGTLRRLAEPRPGRSNALRLPYENPGSKASGTGRATLRVSEPYTAGADCGELGAPVGRVAARTALKSVPAGRQRTGRLQWRPRRASSYGLSITLSGRGDATQGDDLLTSAFAHQTHRIGRERPTAQRFAVRLMVPRGCRSPVRFDITPVALAAGWSISVKGTTASVAPGRSRIATVSVRAPGGARPGSTAIPLVVRATSGGDPGEHHPLYPASHALQPVGGLDVLARVVRGSARAGAFVLSKAALPARPAPQYGRFPFPKPWESLASQP
jgi:hypothetical protein